MSIVRTALLLVLIVPLAGTGAVRAGELSVTPPAVALRGKSDRQQLLVTETADGRAADRTRAARYRSDNPAVAQVGSTGVVTPAGDGTAVIVADVDGREVRAEVKVIGCGEEQPVTFERDVLPVLTRAGCNAGACHGKARGQNG